MNYRQKYKNFWDKQTTALPPDNVEEWYEKYSEETILHIGNNANIIVDAGCSDGKLTCILAQKYKKVYGIDYSKQLLEIASNNLNNNNISNTKLIHADILQIDKVIPENVDVIICSGVIQYISISDFEEFIVKCKTILNSNGKIIITGIPNTKYRDLYLVNFFKLDNYFSLYKLLYKYLKLKLHILFLKLTKKNYCFDDSIGNWYSANDLITIGNEHGYQIEIYNSIFKCYGYRIHAIFKNS